MGRKALAIDPGQALADDNLAFLIVENGQNLNEALSLAQIARRSSPTSPSTADTLAWVYFHQGNYLSARGLLEDSAKRAPDDASIQFHLGMTYLQLHDNADAVLHLKTATAIRPRGKAGAPRLPFWVNSSRHDCSPLDVYLPTPDSGMRQG